MPLLQFFSKTTFFFLERAGKEERRQRRREDIRKMKRLEKGKKALLDVSINICWEELSVCCFFWIVPKIDYRKIAVRKKLMKYKRRAKKLVGNFIVFFYFLFWSKLFDTYLLLSIILPVLCAVSWQNESRSITSNCLKSCIVSFLVVIILFFYFSFYFCCPLCTNGRWKKGGLW